MSSTAASLLQVGLLVVALAVAHKPWGDYLARVFTSTRHLWVERAIYRVARVSPDSEQHWKTYASAVLGFSAVSVILLYLLQRLQSVQPFNFGRGAVEPGIAFNTAVSFVTNTNWQSYVPEKVMGHTVQMVGFTVQNFASAAVGLAVAIALIRGFVRSKTDRLGNFWVDLTRGTIRILLPISFVFALVLIALGVIQSLKSGVDVTNVDGPRRKRCGAPRRKPWPAA